jgi:hypothetical protein
VRVTQKWGLTNVNGSILQLDNHAAGSSRQASTCIDTKAKLNAQQETWRCNICQKTLSRKDTVLRHKRQNCQRAV